MILEKLTFEDMPKAFVLLFNKIDNIETILSKKNESNETNIDQWFNIKDLSAYHPEHPKIQTIYNWVSQRTIPFHKRGKKISFSKAEIDDWIRKSRQKTLDEISQEAVNFRSTKENINLRRS